MTIDDVFATLREKKIALSASGDELVVRGEKRALDPATIALLREHKSALLKSLERNEYVDPLTGVVDVPECGIPVGCAKIEPGMLALVTLTESEIAAVVETVPGGAGNVQDIYPLAPLQEGILFDHLLARDGDPYLLYNVYRCDGRARVDAFAAALQAVIDRHDILRTAIVWDGLPKPVQVVWRHAPLAVEEIDLDGGEGAAERLFDRFDPRRYRLDVRRAPLMRIAIARESGDRWVMVLLVHNLIIDHTALDVMQHEIAAVLSGRGSALPRPLPFRKFVAQARLGVTREEHERFFQRLLGDVEESTVPFGLTDVHGDGTKVVHAQAGIDPALSARVRARARALGVSAASLFHLAWARVLSAVSGRDDVVFGTVVFGRMQGGEGGDQALGLFINTLPVRVAIGDAGVEDSVRSTHALLAALLRHEHASLALAQRCSSVAAPAPLFSALLNYRYFSEAEQAGFTESWEGIETLGGGDASNYPFMLSVNDLGEGFSLSAQMHASLDAPRMCAYVQTALDQLIDALESAPSTPVRRLEVMPAAERSRVLVEWNATEAPYPSNLCLHELFEAQEARTPDAVAVEFEGARSTYAELNASANRIARRLRGAGVGPDDRVALCMERSVEMVAGLLGALKAGGAYVPLEPDYPLERLRVMLKDCGPAAILTHAPIHQSVRDLLHAGEAAVIELDSNGSCGSEVSGDNLEPAGLTSGHLAYVIYTSGSTGMPKGVMIEHRAIVNRLHWMQEAYRLGSGDAVMQKTPYGFDVSVWELFWPLLAGARLVVARAGAHKDPQYIAALVRERHVTTMHFVPSMLQLFLEQDVAGCSSLKRVICSGETLPGSLVRRFFERLPGVELENLYGPTEAAVDVTAWSRGPDAADRFRSGARSIIRARTS